MNYKYYTRTYLNMDDCYINLAVELEREKYGRMLSSALINRYTDNWVLFTDTDFDEDEFPISNEDVLKKIDSWKRKFWFIYDTTKDRYEKLLDVYSEQQANLLAKIGSSSKTKFNDTPQNAGSFDTEEYTTTYTQVDTEIDPTDMMSRLDNIYNKYKNLYAEWVKEFAKLFGEEI